MTKTCHATIYEPLTDEEWSKIRDTVLIAAPQDDTPRRGRKRVDPRPVTNAVLHHLTTGLGIGYVGSAVVDYPSAPTRRRFLQAVIDTQVLSALFMLLDDTRPLLREQYLALYKGKHKSSVLAKNTKIEKEVAAPTSLTWGLNLAPLPWGKPLVLEND